jgi:hypothetical protein
MTMTSLRFGGKQALRHVFEAEAIAAEIEFGDVPAPVGEQLAQSDGAGDHLVPAIARVALGEDLLVAGEAAPAADRLKPEQRLDEAGSHNRTRGRAGAVEGVAVSRAGELREHRFLHPFGLPESNGRRQPLAKWGMVLTGCP